MNPWLISADLQIFAICVVAWEIALGVFLLTRLPATDEFNPVGRDRAPMGPEDRRRIRLCAHAFLRAALLGGFLIVV